MTPRPSHSLFTNEKAPQAVFSAPRHGGLLAQPLGSRKKRFVASRAQQIRHLAQTGFGGTWLAKQPFRKWPHTRFSLGRVAGHKEGNAMSESAALVIHDKDALLVVQTALECNGLHCMSYPDTAALLRGVRRDDVRLLIVDARVPLCEWRSLVDWRNNWLSPSVVLLAVGAADGTSAAAALDAGVDDCVPQPLHGAELLARIKAAQRRRGQSGVSALSLAGCTVDRARSCLRSAHAELELTGRELGIVQLLFEEVGRVVTRQRLASEVWGGSSELIGHCIEQHIYQIRRKLRRCAGGLLVLKGVYGQGYRLERVPQQSARAMGPVGATQEAPPEAPQEATHGVTRRALHADRVPT
jgi:DNA-binding response OmpR family regulator